MKDYYSILGVPEDATQAQIKKIYRKLATIFHPDQADFDKEHATEKFKELNEAYEVLSDSTKRAAYDKQRAKSSSSTDHSKPPRPSVSPVRLDFGTLWKGEQRSELVTVNNLGGAVQEINFTYSEEEAWFAITEIESFSEMEPCPLKVEITVETDALSAGRYDGWLEVDFDGVTARVNLGVQVRIKRIPKPIPRPKPKPKPTPPMNLVCRVCNQVHHADQIYCWSCGYQVSENQFCPHCGQATPASPMAKFCAMCGGRL